MQTISGEMLKVKTDSIFDRAENTDVSVAWCTKKVNGVNVEYNPIATILWKTEGGLIRHFVDSDPVLTKT